MFYFHFNSFDAKQLPKQILISNNYIFIYGKNKVFSFRILKFSQESLKFIATVTYEI